MMGRSGIAAPGGSNLDLTTVDEEFDAIHETGLIGSQEEHRLGDLLGLPDPAQRDLACEKILCALCLVPASEKLVQTCGFGHPRADGIHPDVAILEVEGPVAGEAAYGCLRGR